MDSKPSVIGRKIRIIAAVAIVGIILLVSTVAVLTYVFSLGSDDWGLKTPAVYFTVHRVNSSAVEVVNVGGADIQQLRSVEVMINDQRADPALDASLLNIGSSATYFAPNASVVTITGDVYDDKHRIGNRYCLFNDTR